ncbi:MAG: PQQ-binding-like beta-propeller repeat protein [Candidatus Eisenbacteria bacterium]|nr:PQQ-binding-like beta-propeller repeat protein [Candidatus Eisenbacteria bacterium]
MSRSSWVSRFVAGFGALTAVAGAGAGSGASAQGLIWSFQGVENVVCVVVTPDVDGDGVAEVALDSYDAGPSGVDHLFCVSGGSSGSGTLIWSARPLGGPSNSGGYGDACLRLGPDANGDGSADLLYGAAWGSRTAFTLDGQTGATLWSFDSYSDSPPTPPVSGWVYAMADLGSDLDSDGVNEVVFCLGSDNNSAYCANGATGAIVWRHLGGDALYDLQSIEDVTGDGRRDVVLAMGDAVGGARVVSGSSGATVWSRSAGSCQSVFVHPDANGDGVEDVVAGCWDNQVHCYSGTTGAVIWNAAVGTSVQRVVRLDDVSGDGVDDVAVGSFDRAARVYDGATGTLLWRSLVGTLNGGDVWAIDRLEDVTGDGVNDVCCGSFDTKVYAMDGVTGAILWSYTTGNRVFTVRGGPDLSGNGVPDVVAGTQMISGIGGKCFAIEGGSPTASVELPPSAAGLTANQPNPFATSTSWALSLPATGGVELVIYANDGRRVASPFAGEHFRGPLSIRWDGRDDRGRLVPSGAYWARLSLAGRVLGERRLTVVR